MPPVHDAAFLDVLARARAEMKSARVDEAGILATIKRVQKLMDAKVKGKLPKCLFKPQSKWCAHGIFIAFSRWSSNVFRPVPAPPPDA